MSQFRLIRIGPKPDKPSTPVEKEEPLPVKTFNVTEEIWKFLPIEGILVSNLGFILKLSQNGAKVIPGYWDIHGGRYMVKDKNKKSWKVSHLIAKAFLKPPTQGQVLMHLNENSNDNRPQNLQWGSQKQNINSPLYKRYARIRQTWIEKTRRELSLEKIQQNIEQLNQKHPLKPPSESED